MEQIARARGFRCDAYKEGCLRRRLAVRMRARGAKSYRQYADVLLRDHAEYDRLLDALTINVSRFYRNPETWDVLAGDVLPGLWQRRRGALRCWSAGCAGGEEPYTLGILLLERARRSSAPAAPPVIDATDYDRMSLARAEEASYPSGALRDLPADLTRRYFRGDEPAALVAAVRRVVRFTRQDLTQEPPPASGYDLILCRNVIIYFDRPTQDRVCSRLFDALTPGGYLVLGKVETLRGPARRELVLENPRERIYRRP